MLTVNLISARRAEMARFRKVGEMLLRAGIGLAILTLFYIGLSYWTINNTKNKIAQVELQKTSFQQQADEVRRLRAAQSALSPRVKLVETTTKRLDHWRTLYAQVSSSVPSSAHLENIAIKKTSDGKELNITGRADNAYVISKMLLALNTQPAFSDLVMGPANLSQPHNSQLSAKLKIKPLPEDVAAAAKPAAPATAPTGKN